MQANEMVSHTLTVVKNEKIFLPSDNGAISNRILDMAIQIYCDANEANELNIPKGDKWKERDELQKKAIRRCNRMLGLINIARKRYHIKGRKIKYWCKLVRDTREKIKEWNQGDNKRYKGYE